MLVSSRAIEWCNKNFGHFSSQNHDFGEGGIDSHQAETWDFYRKLIVSIIVGLVCVLLGLALANARAKVADGPCGAEMCV